jgi:hypothetical protein
VQTHQLDEGNNVGATTVTMPMQSEGKEVIGTMTMMPVQQEGKRPCNVGSGTSATRAMMPSWQRQRCLHNDNGDDENMPLKNQFGIWGYEFPLQIKLFCITSNIFLNFSIIMFYLQENCIQVQIPYV